MKKSRTLLESFKYAVSGTIYSFKTQRNIRIHFLTGLAVLLASTFIDFGTVELLIIFFTIALVIITEMINTAIETTVDMVTKEYHPLAEIAKNVAAGAVLVSAINAVMVGYLIFFKRLYHLAGFFLFRTGSHIFIIGLAIVIILVILFRNKSKEV
ncbi:MAG TPA: diacylglycerol kinase [Thermoanaerobacterales bacterium]|nr:diacylglycerol kinase [Thermoanaerobacterales bacterium]